MEGLAVRDDDDWRVVFGECVAGVDHSVAPAVVAGLQHVAHLGFAEPGRLAGDGVGSRLQVGEHIVSGFISDNSSRNSGRGCGCGYGDIGNGGAAGIGHGTKDDAGRGLREPSGTQRDQQEANGTKTRHGGHPFHFCKNCRAGQGDRPTILLARTIHPQRILVHHLVPA